jgi:regulator of CtrA degradation
MRLTTRLLELASWLLIRRALKEGEITQQEAEAKRARVKLQTLGRPAHTKGFSELPQGLRDLIDASFQLHDRIVQLDRAMIPNGEALDAAPANPVATQINTLEQAFGSGLRRAAS